MTRVHGTINYLYVTNIPSPRLIHSSKCLPLCYHNISIILYILSLLLRLYWIIWHDDKVKNIQANWKNLD